VFIVIIITTTTTTKALIKVPCHSYKLLQGHCTCTNTLGHFISP